MEDAPQDAQVVSAVGPTDRRFRPGFPWGVAAGALLAILIVVAGVGSVYLMTFSRISRFSGPGRVTVAPVESGKPWFSIAKDGTGRMVAWTAGSSGSGGGSSQPAGTTGFVEVGAIGLVDGVNVVHSVRMYVTRDTQLLLGGKPYKSGASASQVIVEGQDDTFSARPLTIDFHKSGAFLVADKISAPLQASSNPLQ